MSYMLEVVIVVTGRLKSSQYTILFKLLKEKIIDGEETGSTLLCS